MSLNCYGVFGKNVYFLSGDYCKTYPRTSDGFELQYACRVEQDQGQQGNVGAITLINRSEAVSFYHGKSYMLDTYFTIH